MWARTITSGGEKKNAPSCIEGSASLQRLANINLELSSMCSIVTSLSLIGNSGFMWFFLWTQNLAVAAVFLSLLLQGPSLSVKQNIHQC